MSSPPSLFCRPYAPFRQIRNLSSKSLPWTKRSITAQEHTMCALRRVANIARDAARRCRSTSPLVPSFMSRDRHEDVVLSDGELSQLVHAVEEVSEHDLAVHKHDFIDSSYESTGTITYIGVATEEDVHMAVFVMPPGSSIPLHDHVNMSVVSRVLWGELEVQSYDLVPSSWSNLNAESVAVKHELAVTKAGGVTALTPTSGNIHSFHATEWTAVFDVLVPPYDTEHGRECRYYSPLDGVDDVWSLMPSGGGEREKRKHVHLKEVQCPDWYHTVSVAYKGKCIEE